MNDKGALVLFSGGQDSATCLAWALDRFETVETVGFDYGQRHRVELDCREAFRAAVVEVKPEWSERLGPDHMLDLSVLGQVSETALTRDAEISLRKTVCPTLSCRAAISYFSRWPRRSPIAGICGISSAACARPIIRAILIAETTR